MSMRVGRSPGASLNDEVDALLQVRALDNAAR